MVMSSSGFKGFHSLKQITSAIKDLRRKLGDTQPAFASRLGLSVSAIEIYEKDRKPTLRVLAQLMRLAHSHGFIELATAFQEELEKELGHPVLRIAPSKTVYLERDELEEVDALLTMLRMLGSSGKDDKVLAENVALWRRISEPFKAWNRAREYRLAATGGLVRYISD